MCADLCNTNISDSANKDTIVAPITPMIKSAVILLRVSGGEALNLLQLIVDRKGNKLTTINCNNSIFVKFNSLYDNLSDDILLTYFKAPNSYTGEDVLELSFHGNPIMVSSALKSLYSLGFRDAKRGEFTMRAYLNGKLSLTEAEAVEQFISSKSENELRYAYKQMNGSLINILISFKDKLLNCKAILEADIDFAEDTEISDIFNNLLITLNPLYKDIVELVKSYHSIRKDSKDINITIIGKPNVGKSSLLNKLINKDRAIVSDIAGTTRDYISEKTLISGIPINIIDTAGIRDNADKLESIGIDKAINSLDNSDIIIALYDITDNNNDDDIKKINGIVDKYKEKVIKVLNKADLSSSRKIDADITISVKDDININKLKTMIVDKCSNNNTVDTTFDIATVSERHALLLDNCKDAIQKAISNINNNFPEDMIVFDLNEAIKYIEDIMGENYTEDVLSIIFDSFCIGK